VSNSTCRVVHTGWAITVQSVFSEQVPRPFPRYARSAPVRGAESETTV
jgi:hypothetical protein